VVNAPSLTLAPDELLPLTLFGQPVLHSRAAEVTVFDAALERLVEAMFESMYAAPGVGLAATQVGIGLRVFTYDCGGPHVGHVINPVCERVGTELQEGFEGCLSVPGLDYDTPRSMWARATGVDFRGDPVVVEGDDLLARCLQHETDHLDGMLYLERLGGKVRKQAMKDVKACEWYGQPTRPLVKLPPSQDGHEPELDEAPGSEEL
jgi:peptide deformylase